MCENRMENNMGNTMSKSQKINNYSWSSIFAKNLSNHTDETFKLAQMMKTVEGNILFDLREMFRERKTYIGFSLFLHEFFWMKKVFDSNDKSIHTLQYNQRIIKIDKSTNEYLLIVQKSNGKLSKLLSNKNEITNLHKFIIENNDKIISLAKTLKINIDFTEQSYYRFSIK